MSILELYCEVDDFWKKYGDEWERMLIQDGHKRRRRAHEMSASEIMTILIHFHQACFRNFKHYYTDYVGTHLQSEFPRQLSYPRIVALMDEYLIPLTAYLQSRKGTCTGISFIDSTSLAVCKNPRIHSHRTFENLAKRGKTSTGWFFGFKLHLVVNEQGEILAFCLTPGNVDDRHPVPKLAKKLMGKLIGDKGYLSQSLFEDLFAKGLQLLTRLRKNMENRLMPILDKLLIRKRAVIESIFDQLKNISQIEHSRHRKPSHFLVNLLGGLLAYSFQPTKPTMSREISVSLFS